MEGDSASVAEACVLLAAISRLSRGYLAAIGHAPHLKLGTSRTHCSPREARSAARVPATGGCRPRLMRLATLRGGGAPVLRRNEGSVSEHRKRARYSTLCWSDSPRRRRAACEFTAVAPCGKSHSLFFAAMRRSSTAAMTLWTARTRTTSRTCRSPARHDPPERTRCAESHVRRSCGVLEAIDFHQMCATDI